MAANYDDVLGQLRDAGLLVDTLEVGSGRMVRCKTEGGGKEKRGWYMLHELQASGGDLLIVGSYGVWRGNDNSATKIELRKRDKEFSQEQRDALKRRIAEDRKQAEATRKREAGIAARRAATMWSRLAPTGEADYLAAKGIGAHGLRFTPNNCAVLPLLDTAGTLHGLQFLRTAAQAKQGRRPAKEFWPVGVAKKGHFHLIGAPDWIVLVAEGYATAATLHEATGYPVAVAFDAGNLLPVAEALRARYKRVRILICADDDTFSEGNPGVTAASAAALSVSGEWMAPRFADDEARRAKHASNGHKLTDFNDLHALEGLHVVRTQVEARLTELQWARPAAKIASNLTNGVGGDDRFQPIATLEELLERFALVYGQGGTAFDREEHAMVTLSDMRDACIRRELHRAWMEHPAREIVRIDNVDFDPSESKPGITCNLWGGWPTAPVPGKCDKLLEMLWHMCSADDAPQILYDWVLNWLAYPLQVPGAKMKTAIVVHGPQGTGKNMFFEAYMAIYGKYGRVLDQAALEDKFNAWASRKLFLLADEVVARTEVYHLKNKLKALITGDRIRINPKNLADYEEDNHANLVFLSNEAMPVVLEEDDRRHTVIWTPVELPLEFYRAVKAEIANGGVAALHDYLLNRDLGAFDNATRPPATAAKRELIELGLDSPMRFIDELLGGDIPGLKPRPAPSKEWFEAYKLWCNREGVRAAPCPKFINAIVRKRDVATDRKRYLIEQTVHGPHGFLMLGDCSNPEGLSENVFLGEEVIMFRAALNEFRGRS